MGNAETKDQNTRGSLREDSKSDQLHDTNDILRQIEESPLSYKALKEKNDSRRQNRSNRNSTGGRKKVPQYLDNNRPSTAQQNLTRDPNIPVSNSPSRRKGTEDSYLSTKNGIKGQANGVSEYAASRLKSGYSKSPDAKRGPSSLGRSMSTQREVKINKRQELQERRQKAVLLQAKLNYSNSDLLDVRTLLDMEVLNSCDPNQILFEGELLKYKPGTSFNWVERWCRVTRTQFMYYKNAWTAQCPDLKPLMSVPITEIVAIFRVNLELPDHKTQQPPKKDLSSISKSYKEIFQFEIFSEMTDYPYKDEVYETEPDEEIIAKEREQHHRQQTDEEEKKMAQQVNVAQLEGFRLWDEYQEKKQRESPAKARKKGYLMRPPLTYKTYRKTRESVRKTRDVTNRELLEIAYGVHSNTSKQRGSHKNPYIDNEEDRAFSPPKRKTSPERRMSPSRQGAAYKWVKDSTDLTSWSGREREWFYSEKRLLFASSKLKEREVWVAVLNWLFDKMMSEEYDSKLYYTVEDS